MQQRIDLQLKQNGKKWMEQSRYLIKISYLPKDCMSPLKGIPPMNQLHPRSGIVSTQKREYAGNTMYQNCKFKKYVGRSNTLNSITLVLSNVRWSAPSRDKRSERKWPSKEMEQMRRMSGTIHAFIAMHFSATSSFIDHQRKSNELVPKID